jgi:hypothetical protein
MGHSDRVQGMQLSQSSERLRTEKTTLDKNSHLDTAPGLTRHDLSVRPELSLGQAPERRDTKAENFHQPEVAVQRSSQSLETRSAAVPEASKRMPIPMSQPAALGPSATQTHSARVQPPQQERYQMEAKRFSDLLRVQPEQQIRFGKASSSMNINLTNVSRCPVAFKFKASHASCLARPSMGILQPGQQRDVQLSLGVAFSGQAVRETYLIQAAMMESSAEVGPDEWASIDKRLVRETRLAAMRG